MITIIGAMRTEISMLMGMNDPNSEKELGKQKKIKTFFCGSGFNIAGHLADQGHQVSFITVLGNDPCAVAAIAELERRGIGTGGIRQVKGTTPIQIRFYNVLGDIEQEYKNDEILDNMDTHGLEECRELLDESEIIVVDGSLPVKTLEFVAEEYGNLPENSPQKPLLFFDPESVKGAIRARELSGGFYCVMPGRMEAEAMTGLSILSPDELMEAGKTFEERGSGRTFITMKGGGLYYKEGISEGILKPERVLTFANTGGVGDVVSAAIVSGYAKGMDVEETAKYAMDKGAEYLAAIKDEKLI